ncbi:MAG: ABC transporter ATP-binding protein [Deltaproteobacteria bacterium]
MLTAWRFHGRWSCGPVDQGAMGLYADRITVRAGARRIVDEVSFRALAGEVMAVIGPNGAGKTSLLEAIVGLRCAESGALHVAGKRLASFRDHARMFAYLPDQGEVATEVTGRTLVRHALACATGEAPVAELRQLLEIEPLLDRGAAVLSRGERQRLLLFCTLVLGRRFVVLDEPFSAFDPLQLEKLELALRCVTGAGATILASIHQLADAEQIADRVLLLAEGRALAFGTLAELKAIAGAPQMTLRDVFLALLARRPGAA